MKKILLIGNYDIGIYNFRLELVEELLKDYQVYIALPYGKRVEYFRQLGCHYLNTPMSRHGTNIIGELRLLRCYLKIIRDIKPNLVLTYTIKPNIYGAMASSLLKVPSIPTITGLGIAVEKTGLLKNIVVCLYRICLRKAPIVFFQNRENLNFFKQEKIKIQNYKLVNGSGVNIDKFSFLPYPENENTKFLFVGRIMKAKGIEEYLYAAENIKKCYPQTEFFICGLMEDAYQEKIDELEKQKVVTYLGMLDDVRDIFKDIHCVILPSYHEGMSNALLEAAASGRPILASNIPGCRETFDDGLTGIVFFPRDKQSLVKAVEKFILLPFEQKKAMGIAARKKMEREFDRKMIVASYMETIRKLTK